MENLRGAPLFAKRGRNLKLTGKGRLAWIRIGLRLDQREQLIEPDLQILNVIRPQCGVAKRSRAAASALAFG